MVEVQTLREKLVKTFSQMEFDADGVPGREMVEVEREIIGADHCAFGAALCESWKFPKSFGFVTGFHHDPSELPEGSRLLTSVVYVADRLATEAGYGFRADLTSTDCDKAILEELRMGSEHLQAVRDALPEAYADVEGHVRLNQGPERRSLTGPRKSRSTGRAGAGGPYHRRTWGTPSA